MTPLFTCGGEYVGFIANGTIFDAHSNYRGWIDGCSAWNSDGTYLGEVMDEHYILRNNMDMEPMAQMARMPPMPPMPPLPQIARMPRMPRLGWIDVLE